MVKITEVLLILTSVCLVTIATIHFTKGAMQEQVVIMPQQQQPLIIQNGDDRYRRAPRPQRFWENEPEIPTRGAFNQPTQIASRGAPESYQQMGVMVGSDGKPLPLYGRRTAPRSDRYNYYTRTDSYNPVALPVTYKKKDCQDNLGCDELFNGDNVKISATGETAKVTLYGFDGPRYTPDIA